MQVVVAWRCLFTKFWPNNDYLQSWNAAFEGDIKPQNKMLVNTDCLLEPTVFCEPIFSSHIHQVANEITALYLNHVPCNCYSNNIFTMILTAISVIILVCFMYTLMTISLHSFFAHCCIILFS